MAPLAEAITRTILIHMRVHKQLTPAWRLLMAGGMTLLASSCFDAARFQNLLHNNDIEGARRMLREEQAGDATAPPDADEKVVASRRSYMETVERMYLGQHADALQKGYPKTAMRALRQGLEHCPWSQRIPPALADLDATIDRLDRLEIRWAGQAQGATWNDVENFFAIPADVRRLSREHPGLWKLTVAADEVVLRDAARAVLATPGDAAVVARTDAVVSVTRPMPGLLAAARAAAALPQRLNDDQVVPLLSTLSTLDPAQTMADASRGGDWQGLATAILQKNRAWIRDVLLPWCSSHEVSFTTISALIGSRDMLERHGLRPAWTTTASAALLRRAEATAGLGRESALALIYAHAADQISPESVDEASIKSKALASLRTTLPVEVGFRVKVTAAGDPTVAAYVEDMLTRVCNGRRRSFVRDPSQRPGLSPAHWVAIEITKLSYIRGRVENLPERRSQYLSHYENVTNPQKQRLADALRYAKLEISLAESALNSAISTHNIYPTQYSLINVNSARYRYNAAISSHNMTVAQYNATPDTISQPVFMPYAFREGRIQHGWEVSARVSVQGRDITLPPAASIDSDFVRFGARPEDTVPSNRSNDRLDLDMSVDRSLAHLYTVLSDVADQISPQLAGLSHATGNRLDPVEATLLGWFLHPWDDQGARQPPASIPAWCVGYAQSDLIGGLRPRVPVITITSPPPLSPPNDLPGFIAQATPTVCQVLALDNGRSVGTSTGTFISPDGHVLACAHGLTGATVAIRARIDGEWQQFSAEIVYVDMRLDAAVLRTTTYRPRAWAAVRLRTPAVAGEPVVAIGFPGTDDGGVAEHAATSGSIAVPRLTYGGAQRSMVDITIASGSSGGPIFSRQTGEVIGIVESVVAPGITEGFGRSGFAAFMVPATELPAAVGLCLPDASTSTPP